MSGSNNTGGGIGFIGALPSSCYVCIDCVDKYLEEFEEEEPE